MSHDLASSTPPPPATAPPLRAATTGSCPFAEHRPGPQRPTPESRRPTTHRLPCQVRQGGRHTRGLCGLPLRRQSLEPRQLLRQLDSVHPGSITSWRRRMTMRRSSWTRPPVPERSVATVAPRARGGLCGDGNLIRPHLELSASPTSCYRRPPPAGLLPEPQARTRSID